MKNTKYTPGPWKVEHKSEEIFPSGLKLPAVKQIWNQNTLVATINENHVNGDMEAEDQANAALIAAAPDLYSACEIVLNNLTTSIPANEDLKKLSEKACIDALMEALKKARGEA